MATLMGIDTKIINRNRMAAGIGIVTAMIPNVVAGRVHPHHLLDDHDDAVGHDHRRWHDLGARHDRPPLHSPAPTQTGPLTRTTSLRTGWPLPLTTMLGSVHFPLTRCLSKLETVPKCEQHRVQCASLKPVQLLPQRRQWVP